MLDNLTNEELNAALYDAQGAFESKNVAPQFFRDAVDAATEAVQRQIADGDLPKDTKELREALISRMEELGITDPDIQDSIATQIGVDVFNQRMVTQNEARFGEGAHVMEQLEDAVRIMAADGSENVANNYIDRAASALLEGDPPLISKVDKGFFSDGGEFENFVRESVKDTMGVYGIEVKPQELEDIIDGVREKLADEVSDEILNSPTLLPSFH